MRWTALTVAVGALLAPATASAEQQIVATTASRYATTAITMAQGEVLNFRNEDLSGPSHDVVSTANGSAQKRYLFASETIPNGKTSFVEGSQYLTTGTYDFYCSLHPDQMKGTLTVTSAGAPKPRPGTDPAAPGTPTGSADDTPPEASIAFGTLRARTIKRLRRLSLTVGADEAATLTVSVRIGARKLKPLKVKLDRARTRKVVFKLGASARKALTRGRRLRVVVEAVDSAGNPGSATDSVKLE